MWHQNLYRCKRYVENKKRNTYNLSLFIFIHRRYLSPTTYILQSECRKILKEVHRWVTDNYWPECFVSKKSTESSPIVTGWTATPAFFTSTKSFAKKSTWNEIEGISINKKRGLEWASLCYRVLQCIRHHIYTRWC